MFHPFLVGFTNQIYNIMSRRKQNSLFPNPIQQPKKDIQTSNFPVFVPEFPLTNKMANLHNPDSLQRFQWELENSLLKQREMQINSQQYDRKAKRRVMTEYAQDSDREDEVERISSHKIKRLQKQVEELKGEIVSSKGSSGGLEDKLDKLLQEMVRNREADRQYFKQQRPSQPPNNIFYPPMPMYPHPTNPYDAQKPRERYDRTTSTFQPKSFKARSPRRLLRKYFFVVLFTKYLKKQAQQLAQVRKKKFRKFFVDKFDSQILNLKNWLVQCHGFAFPVILQKQDISLDFWAQKRQVIQRQKQGLLLSLIKLGLQKMKKDCTSQKLSLFTEILHNLCMRGSFVMSRFWSAFQMQSICISDFYGCVRAEDSLEKYMIGMVVFIKVLIFNMFLQPYKFDSINFGKSKKTLINNMIIIGSVYYRLTKEILREYLDQNRPKYYRLGNWLSVRQQFIVQCCEPLKFNCDYPEEGEYITGLIGSQLQILEMRNEWGGLKARIQQIITILHRELTKRRKDTLKGEKFKLYN